MRVIGIVLFALIMSINGFVFGVISLQLVPLLEAAGLVGATAVWVASLKGHGQFAGRLVEIFFGRNLKAMTIARIAIAVVPASLVLLLLARGDLWQLVAFTLLLGAVARCHHDRSRRRPARTLWCERLWRGAWPDRNADPAGQRLLASHLRAGGGPVRLANLALRAAGLLDSDLDRHRADVALVQRSPIARMQSLGGVRGMCRKG